VKQKEVMAKWGFLLKIGEELNKGFKGRVGETLIGIKGYNRNKAAQKRGGD